MQEEVKMQEVRTVLRYENGILKGAPDTLVTEYALELLVNGESFAHLLCSPKDVESLCIGYLYGENKITSAEDIAALAISAEAGKAFVTLQAAEKSQSAEKITEKAAYLTTGLGPQKSIIPAFLAEAREALSGGPALSGQKISDLAAAFQGNSSLFRETGGVHSAALSDGDNIIASFDDIGRHNALDKVIGFALKEGLDLNKYLLLTSGRIPGYMAYKCYHAGIPFVVSRSAVTAQAVDFAKKTGMTLIGFARDSRFNIYSGEERVLADE